MLPQVKGNRIETLAPGILMGANVDAATPFLYPDNVNVAFTGNSIAYSQFSPFCVTSAGGITFTGNTFHNLMCR